MLTIFKDWKGQLGWSFTAEECREEWRAKREAAKFMKKFGRPKVSESIVRTAQRVKPLCNMPEVMTKRHAVQYFRITDNILRYSIKKGVVHPIKYPNDSRVWVLTSEVDYYVKNYRHHVKNKEQK